MTNKNDYPRTTEESSAFDSRIERISKYETMKNEAEQAVSAMEKALEDFADAQEKLEALNSYYGSELWREDYEASEAGELPPDLRCGVLSEDGIWNLLERNRELLEDLQGCLDRLTGRGETP